MPEKHKSQMERLLSSVNTEGLIEPEAGLFVSKNVHPSDTLSSAAPLAEVLLQRLSRDTANSKQELSAIAQRIKGTILVDLGAGSEISGYKLAELCGASGYIAIEANHYIVLHRQLSKMTRAKGSIPAIVLGEDMRSALGRFPDNTASLLACNIDASVLFAAGADTIQALNEEMSRVLHPDGALVSYASVLSGSNLNQTPISNAGNSHLQVFRKSD